MSSATNSGNEGKHHLAHYFIRNRDGLATPLWYDEGFAHFLSTVEVMEMPRCCSSSRSRERSTVIALALFLCCDFSSWQVTTRPVGSWVMRTALSVVLTC